MERQRNVGGVPKAARHVDGMDMDKCEPNDDNNDKCQALLGQILQAQMPKKKPFYDSAIDRCQGDSFYCETPL